MPEETGMTKKEQAAQDAAVDKLFKVNKQPVQPPKPKLNGRK